MRDAMIGEQRAMNPEFKAKWLDALRSEDYEQGTGTLRYNLNGVDRFCCLGVLCQVAELGEWNKIEDQFSDDEVEIQATYYSMNGQSGTLRPKELEIVGFNEVVQQRLYHMNDNDRKTFSEIADWIEENL